LEKVAEFLESSEKQSHNCHLGALHLLGRFGDRAALQMVQLDRPALVFGQLRQSAGQAEMELLPHGLLTR
jgi:hypothetical protein